MKGNDYPNNKLYFQMWVAELQARLLKHPEYLHITVNGVNPGFVASGLWIPVQGEGEGESEGEGEGDDVLGRILGLLLRYFAISPQQGSVAITHAATSAELGPDPTRQNVGAPGGRGGGKYINRVWEAAPKVFCNDPDARSRLWIKLDEELHLREKGLLGVLGL